MGNLWFVVCFLTDSYVLGLQRTKVIHLNVIVQGTMRTDPTTQNEGSVSKNKNFCNNVLTREGECITKCMLSTPQSVQASCIATSV